MALKSLLAWSDKSVPKQSEMMLPQPVKSRAASSFDGNRRNFLKGSAILAGGAAANLTLLGASMSEAAAAIGAAGSAYPQCLLDLPLNYDLYALTGSDAVVSRSLTWLQGEDAQLAAELALREPRFAVDELGLSLGVVSRHTGAGATESENAGGSGEYLRAVQNFDDIAWFRNKVLLDGPDSSGLSRITEAAVRGWHGISQVVSGLDTNQIYTVSMSLRSDQLRYVGLQLKTYAGEYHIARFDLTAGAVHSQFRAVDSGISRTADGLIRIWASFNSQSGGQTPVVSFQLLSDKPKLSSYVGSNRSAFVAAISLSRGAAPVEVSAPEQGIELVDASVLPGDFSDASWTKANVTVATSGDSSGSIVLGEGYGFGNHLVKRVADSLKPDNVYTVNAVVKNSNLRYVAIQLKAYDVSYPIVRYDLFSKSVFKRFGAIDCGVIPVASGGMHIWASFNSGAGTALPVVSMMLCDGNGAAQNFAGAGRSVEVADFCVSHSATPSALSANAAVGSASSGGASSSVIVEDAISTSRSGNFLPNNCAGIFSFQFRKGSSARQTILYTGTDESNYAEVSITDTRLLFAKVVNGISTVCAHDVTWSEGEIYRVGWRSSASTGMELVLNGRTVAADDGLGARRDMQIGDRLFFGSSGRSRYSNCPISNFMIFSEA